MLHDLDMQAEIAVLSGNPEICITCKQRAEQNIRPEVAYGISFQTKGGHLL